MVREAWETDVRDEADNWTKIQDAAARKRAQNRLAQRAHRRKYGRSKKSKKDQDSSPSSESSSATSVEIPGSLQKEQSNPGKDVPAEDVSLDQLDLSFLDAGAVELPVLIGPTPPTPTALASTKAQWPQAMPFIEPLSTFPDSIFIQTTLTISAMLVNASLMAIPCNPPNRIPSIHIGPSTITPPSLTPTALQSTVPHFPYIDLLPFPSLRDRLLRVGDMIDGREIWDDLHSDVKVWGNSPWDEKGWEVGERFAIKWWFLMSEEVIAVANWWRGLRGERSLTGLINEWHRKGTVEEVA